METDKRPFYIWLLVIFANIGTITAIGIEQSNYSSNSPSFDFWSLIWLAISLFISAVPVLISNSNNKWKNRWGYGIPISMLLPLPYFVWDYYTCTGKFCQIGPLILGCIFSISAVTFALFYAIGIYARKWNVKFIISLLLVELVLLVGLFIYYGIPELNGQF